MSSDWLPRSREGRLKMAQSWLSWMKCNAGKRWGISEEFVGSFEKIVSQADNEFFRAKKDRTIGTNVLLKEAFEKLAEKMRDVKRRSFLVPPLINADLAVLGLHPHNTTHTPIGKPVGKFGTKITYTASGALQVNIIPDDESATHSKSNFGYRIYHGVYGLRETPPATGKDLRESKFSHHKKLVFTFEPEDKGKTAYFCIRGENGKGDAGEWGDLSSALIP